MYMCVRVCIEEFSYVEALAPLCASDFAIVEALVSLYAGDSAIVEALAIPLLFSAAYV